MQQSLNNLMKNGNLSENKCFKKDKKFCNKDNKMMINGEKNKCNGELENANYKEKIN